MVYLQTCWGNACQTMELSINATLWSVAIEWLHASALLRLASEVPHGSWAVAWAIQSTGLPKVNYGSSALLVDAQVSGFHVPMDKFHFMQSPQTLDVAKEQCLV